MTSLKKIYPFSVFYSTRKGVLDGLLQEKIIGIISFDFFPISYTATLKIAPVCGDTVGTVKIVDSAAETAN